MKRTAMFHSKLNDLEVSLQIPKYAAVGILECLWHLTAREAPAGDLGKLTNQVIARSIGWTGDPDTFIVALVNTRWLDSSTSHRLVVHDWHDHCDEAVKKQVRRSGLRFASLATASQRQTTAGSGRQRREVADNGGKVQPALALALAASLAEPVPVPDNGGQRQTTADNGDQQQPEEPLDGEALLNRMWKRHPKKQGRYLAAQALSQVLDVPQPIKVAQLIEQVHLSWCASESWTKQGGRYCPRLDCWLLNQGYMDGQAQEGGGGEIEYPKLA